jgi:uncharacterized membrane protein YphA (DoxX/SURF4 family)
MADEPVIVHSESWTGQVPKPRPRKPASKLQLSIGLFLSAVIFVRAPWAVFNGFRNGIILVPLSKWHETVSIQNPVEFWICVFGWSFFFLLMSAIGFACARLLLRKSKA